MIRTFYAVLFIALIAPPLLAEEAPAPPRFFIERIEVRNAKRVSPDVIISESRLREAHEYTEQELLGQGYTTTEIENCEAQVDKEIYEWRLVSSWLIAKLRDRGEAILVNEYGAWWGRACTGQAIALDGVIEDIYNELIAS